MQELYKNWGISNDVLMKADTLEASLLESFQEIDRVREYNQLKVLKAFQDQRMAESDLAGSSGYGYDDRGRDKLEAVYAQVFGAEDALVRWQIASGTHALALCLYGILRPGDELLSVAGDLYDTMQGTLGNTGLMDQGSLRDFGISYKQVELLDDGAIDFKGIRENIHAKTKMVWIQRSRGYRNRPAISIESIEKVVQICREVKEDVVICVDNCYGEFVEKQEPTEVGVDLMAGSLIKNPGGGIAQTGGYVVGRTELVEKAASRLTAPGVAGEIGPTMGVTRALAQGFYQAPHAVSECLKGLVFTSALLESLGFQTSPNARDKRSDIVQVITFEEATELISFCKAIQTASPVDSFVSPVPAEMPGYDSPVIMAAGAFVQGSSMELSADGPIRKPYQAFMQGGIVYENIKLAALAAAETLRRRGD